MSKNTVKFSEYAALFLELLQSFPQACHIQVDVKNDFTLPANWGFNNRINPNFHLAYIRSGEGSYVLGNRVEEMVKGKIILISPGFSHSRLLHHAKLPAISLVRFSMMTHADMRPLELNRPFAFGFIPKDTMLFHTLFNQLARIETLEELDGKLCGTIITQILMEMYQEMDTRSSSNQVDPRIERVISFINEQLHEPISMIQLANLSGLSLNYFRILFKQELGRNPHDYITEQRMNKAMELLHETDESVKDISQILGYCDPFAFSKQFKAIFGIPPSHIKKK